MNKPVTDDNGEGFGLAGDLVRGGGVGGMLGSLGARVQEVPQSGGLLDRFFEGADQFEQERVERD